MRATADMTISRALARLLVAVARQQALRNSRFFKKMVADDTLLLVVQEDQ